MVAALKSFNLMLFLLLASGCAGYRFKNTTNPFEQYQIRSVAIPMFVNRSALPLVSGYFTAEIRLMLSEFSELELYGDEGRRADAVLVGVINSQASLTKALETSTTLFISDDLQQSIGNRPAFYLPTGGEASLVLTLVLIKNPNSEDMELINSPFLPFITNHPKIVFSESFNLSSHFNRSIQASLGPDSGGVLNATRNKKILDRTLKQMAKNASAQFKQVVIYAF